MAHDAITVQRVVEMTSTQATDHPSSSSRLRVRSVIPDSFPPPRGSPTTLAFHLAPPRSNGEPKSTSSRSIVSIDPYRTCISFFFFSLVIISGVVVVLSVEFSFPGVINTVELQVKLPKLGSELICPV